MKKKAEDPEEQPKKKEIEKKSNSDIMDVILYNLISGDSSLLGMLSAIEKVADPSLKTPTKLKGERLYYNPDKLAELGQDAQVQVFGEIMHLALMHPKRRKNAAFNPQVLPLADLAADLAVFHQLAPNSERFPSPEKFGFEKGQSFESYFKQLLEKTGPKGDGSGGVKPNPNWVKQDHSGWDEVSELTQVQQQAVAKSFKDTFDGEKSKGDVSKGIVRLVENIPKSIVNWKKILASLIGDKLATDKKRYTMKRPSRRWGTPYQGKKRLRKGTIVVAVDTSGSISDDELKAFLGEVFDISKLHQAPLRLIQCDCSIWGDIIIKNASEIDNIKWKGRGGTSSIPVFNVLKKSDTDLLIFFTDLETDFPTEKPYYPVIWAVPVSGSNDYSYQREVPFGTVYEMRNQEK